MSRNAQDCLVQTASSLNYSCFSCSNRVLGFTVQFLLLSPLADGICLDAYTPMISSALRSRKLWNCGALRSGQRHPLVLRSPFLLGYMFVLPCVTCFGCTIPPTSISHMTDLIPERPMFFLHCCLANNHNQYHHSTVLTCYTLVSTAVLAAGRGWPKRGLLLAAWCCGWAEGWCNSRD